MKMSDWLLNHYKKRFGEDITILEHDSGSTWNDGGWWYNTLIETKDGIFRVYMPTDYQQNRLEVTKMKAVMKEVYVPE